MAKKSRVYDTTYEATRPTTSGRSALPVASRSWTDIAFVRPPGVTRVASPGFQPDVRRSPRTRPRQGPLRPTGAVSFGSWSLPPSFMREAFVEASTCARRHVRREILFATGGRRPGAHSPRKHFSNRRCK